MKAIEIIQEACGSLSIIAVCFILHYSFKYRREIYKELTLTKPKSHAKV